MILPSVSSDQNGAVLFETPTFAEAPQHPEARGFINTAGAVPVTSSPGKLNVIEAQTGRTAFLQVVSPGPSKDVRCTSDQQGNTCASSGSQPPVSSCPPQEGNIPSKRKKRKVLSLKRNKRDLSDCSAKHVPSPPHHEEDLSSDFEEGEEKRKEKHALSPPDADEDLSSDFETHVKKRKGEERKGEDEGKKKSAGPHLDTQTIKKILCKYCKVQFSSWPSVSRHRKTCQLNPDRNQSIQLCTTCGKSFSRNYVFQAHIQTCKPGNKKKELKKTACPMPGCTLEFLFKTSLHKHLIESHKQTDLKKSSKHKFPSYDAFIKWKTNIEDKTFSYYSQQYGRRNGKMYFYCQKDGENRCHDREKKRKTSRRNCKGSVKTNHLCLSMMSVVCQEDGSVNVLFYPSHFHKCLARDLKYQPLSAETNEFIRRQLAWNVPPRKIVENLRDDSYKRENRWQKRPLKRDNLVKVKTIAERRRKNKTKQRYDKDEATSVYMKAQALMNETYNPVLIYKPQGMKLVCGPQSAENLDEDIFLFGFQTKEQLEMMKKHSKVILVMDETHDTNDSGYKLLNLMVKDEFNLGYPVGHLITSKSDGPTLQHFHRAIKERCPDIIINCCITDDDPALINGLQAGMGFLIWHILCIWHIHRTVQINLREHVKDPNLVEEMYQVISLLIDAPTEDEFIKIKNAFLQEYGHISKGFTKYFNNTFLPKAKKWAMCYRQEPHGGVETTMLVESFHNILKSVYLLRRYNKRIDDLIDLLLQVEEDYFVRHENAMQLQTLLPQDVRKIRNRHDKGKKIDDDDVTKTAACFLVKSQDENIDDLYKVVRCGDRCEADLCIFTCPSCVICSHMYQCTCPDTQPLCKHIHKVHLKHFANPEASLNEPEVEQVPEFFTGDIEDSLLATDEVAQNTDFSIDKKLEKIKEIMKRVEIQLENSPVKKFMLSRIQNVLSDLDAQCQMLSEGQMNETTVKKGANKVLTVAPNEKLKPQVKPFVKSTKQKKQGLQRPSKKSAEEIKKFLFVDDDRDVSEDSEYSGLSDDSEYCDNDLDEWEEDDADDFSADV